MDEYFSRCEYLQEKALLTFSSFFIIASKMVEPSPLSTKDVAADLKVSIEELSEMELQVMKAL